MVLALDREYPDSRLRISHYTVLSFITLVILDNEISLDLPLQLELQMRVIWGAFSLRG